MKHLIKFLFHKTSIASKNKYFMLHRFYSPTFYASQCEYNAHTVQILSVKLIRGKINTVAFLPHESEGKESNSVERSV